MNIADDSHHIPHKSFPSSYLPMKTMTESTPRVKDMLSSIMREQLRRVTGNYIQDREKLRAQSLADAQIICWRNDILLLASQTKFPVKRIDVNSDVFESQIHFWEEPRPIDINDHRALQSKGVKNLDNVVIVGSVFAFYKYNGQDECITGNIHCRNWKNWDSIQEKDLIVLYAANQFPEGDVDNLESQFQDFLTMNAFLNSPYAFAEPRNIKTRNRHAKQNKSQRTNVVILRKTPKIPLNLNLHQTFASQFYPEMIEKNEAKQKRMLSVRFNVKGHWRQQWYASEKTHRKIWISGYEKGPDGKPFQSSIRVIKAIR